MILTFDIETIPTDNEIVIQKIRESIKPPANITKQETIEKWVAENFESAFKIAVHKTCLDGLLGRICSVAWQIDDYPVESITLDGSITEKDLIENLFFEIENFKDKNGQRIGITKWCGHYITGFDLRFLWQRCVILGVKPGIEIPYNAKPWDDCVFDTKIQWTGASASYPGRGGLDDMCLGMGFDGKGEINGSMIWDLFLQGKYDEIAEYNRDDVRKVRNLYNKMNFITDDLRVA